MNRARARARIDGFGVWSRRLPVSSGLSGLGGERKAEACLALGDRLDLFPGSTPRGGGRGVRARDRHQWCALARPITSSEAAVPEVCTTRLDPTRRKTTALFAASTAFELVISSWRASLGRACGPASHRAPPSALRSGNKC